MIHIVFHGHLRQRFGRNHAYVVHSVQESVKALSVTLGPRFVEAFKVGHYRVVLEPAAGNPDINLDLHEDADEPLLTDDGSPLQTSEVAPHMDDTEEDGNNWQRIDISLNDLSLGIPPNMDLHFYPSVAGAGPVGRAIAGVAIIGAAFYFAPAILPSVAAGAAPVGAATAGLGATAFAGITYGQVALFGAAIALSGVSQLLAPSPQDAPTARDPVDENPSSIYRGPVNVYRENQPVPLVYGRIRTGSNIINFDSFVGRIAVEQVDTIESLFATGIPGK